MNQPSRPHALAILLFLAVAVVASMPVLAEDGMDLTHATFVYRSGATTPPVERTAVVVLLEEIEKRSRVKWSTSTAWPKGGWSVAVLSGKNTTIDGKTAPERVRTTLAEGYGIATDTSSPTSPILWIAGTDVRGALFGVGKVLRSLECRKGSIRLPSPLNLTSAPAYPIRGHQLGYRANANSYDAWSPAQFDQYIRELALFGTNAIEGIPFQDTRPTVNPYPRSKMNVDLSRICQRYGQDYWLWAPADFDLKDNARRSKFLQEHDDLFRDCPTLTGVFVAGGDPGDNPAGGRAR